MRYSETHEWAMADGDEAIIGISAFAKNELGEIVFVDLPEVGSYLKKGDECAVLESTKAAADMYAPISGEVIAVNEALKTSTAAINSDPEAAGWLFRVRMTTPEELHTLFPKSED